MKVVLKVFQNSSLTNVLRVPVNRTTIYLEILLLVKNQDPFERGVWVILFECFLFTCVKQCVKICVKLFKMWKYVFEPHNQTGPQIFWNL